MPQSISESSSCALIHVGAFFEMESTLEDKPTECVCGGCQRNPQTKYDYKSMTRFPADLFKILPNLEAVKIRNGSETNECPMRSGMSFLTLGCYLFPACAGLFLLVCLSWTPPQPRMATRKHAQCS